MITGITLIGALPFMGLVCSYCEKNRQTEPTFTHTNRISKTKIPKFVIGYTSLLLHIVLNFFLLFKNFRRRKIL